MEESRRSQDLPSGRTEAVRGSSEEVEGHIWVRGLEHRKGQIEETDEGYVGC